MPPVSLAATYHRPDDFRKRLAHRRLTLAHRRLPLAHRRLPLAQFRFGLRRR